MLVCDFVPWNNPHKINTMPIGFTLRCIVCKRQYCLCSVHSDRSYYSWAIICTRTKWNMQIIIKELSVRFQPLLSPMLMTGPPLHLIMQYQYCELNSTSAPFHIPDLPLRTYCFYLLLHKIYKNLAIANRSRVSYINTNYTMTLKSGLEVTKGHWKWYYLKAWVRFPIRLLYTEN